MIAQLRHECVETASYGQMVSLWPGLRYTVNLSLNLPPPESYTPATA